MDNSKFNNDYLSFIIDDKTFAVPILSLQGIVGNPDISPITDHLEFVVGIFYMNNCNIPILDLRVILKKPNLISPNKTCVVIVRISFKGQEKLVGFIVDSFFSIEHLQISEIKKLPSVDCNDFIEGVCYQQDKMVLLLSLEKIINEKNIICFLNQLWNYENLVNDVQNRRNKHGV